MSQFLPVIPKKVGILKTEKVVFFELVQTSKRIYKQLCQNFVHPIYISTIDVTVVNAMYLKI